MSWAYQQIRRTGLPPRTKPLRRVSKKRAREAVLRAATRQQVLNRDLGCVARGVLDHECSGPIEVHELVRRSQWRNGYLVVSNCVSVCAVAHRWIGLHPYEAVELGLAKWSWQREA